MLFNKVPLRRAWAQNCQTGPQRDSRKIIHIKQIISTKENKKWS